MSVVVIAEDDLTEDEGEGVAPIKAPTLPPSEGVVGRSMLKSRASNYDDLWPWLITLQKNVLYNFKDIITQGEGEL